MKLIKAIAFIIFLTYSSLVIVSTFFHLTGIGNRYFALAIPSIIFKESLESCCYSLANNFVTNVIFVIVFWTAIGVITAYCVKRVFRK